MSNEESELAIVSNSNVAADSESSCNRLWA